MEYNFKHYYDEKLINPKEKEHVILLIPGLPEYRQPSSSNAPFVTIKLYVLERPGIGLSTFANRNFLDFTEDIKEFCLKKKINHCSMIAYSAGGPYGLAAAHELTRMMMMRYHEEQVWSDKIRSASTYGTISLILLNFILFICVQTVFEPRKRQKLADKFEELLIVRSNEEEGRLKNDIFQLLKEQLQKLEKRFNELLNVSTITTATLPSSLISNEPKDIIIEQETAVKDNEQGVNNNPDEIEAINYSDSSSTLNLIKQNNPKIVHLSTDELENITIISAILGASVGILLSLAFNEIFRR
ncbi:10751_t:CDS:2 [Entrophospora sp. SA101]|nr:10751_t:CDS:2 [Entrophospora sp. SA101]